MRLRITNLKLVLNDSAGENHLRLLVNHRVVYRLYNWVCETRAGFAWRCGGALQAGGSTAIEPLLHNDHHKRFEECKGDCTPATWSGCHPVRLSESHVYQVRWRLLST